MNVKNSVIVDFIDNFYKLLYRIRYSLVVNIDNKVGCLQANLNRIHRLPDARSYVIREVDINNPAEIKEWINIIEESYGDEKYDHKKAIQQFQNHLFLKDTQTFFIMDKSVPVGTVSIGVYKGKEHIGGIFRIAILKNYQGHGLGKLMLLYGYHQLRERGINYGESIITLKRESSIMLHYSCGFKAQHNMRYISYKGILDNINLIQKLRIKLKLKRMYKIFRRRSDEKLISDY